MGFLIGQDMSNVTCAQGIVICDPFVQDTLTQALLNAQSLICNHYNCKMEVSYSSVIKIKCFKWTCILLNTEPRSIEYRSSRSPLFWSVSLPELAEKNVNKQASGAPVIYTSCTEQDF